MSTPVDSKQNVYSGKSECNMLSTDVLGSAPAPESRLDLLKKDLDIFARIKKRFADAATTSSSPPLISDPDEVRIFLAIANAHDGYLGSGHKVYFDAASTAVTGGTIAFQSTLSAVPYNVDAVGEGVEVNQRIGRVIRCHRLRIRAICTVIETSVTQSLFIAPEVRTAVIWDKQPALTLTLAENAIVPSTGTNAYITYGVGTGTAMLPIAAHHPTVTGSRIEFLHDSVQRMEGVSFPGSVSAGTTVAYNANRCWRIDIDIPLHGRTITYYDATGVSPIAGGLSWIPFVSSDFDNYFTSQSLIWASELYFSDVAS